MPVEVKFSCGHRIGVAYVDACTQMVCPFCAAKPKPAPEARGITIPFDLWDEIHDFIYNQVDVRDGADGPRPNRAMHLFQRIEAEVPATKDQLRDLVALILKVDEKDDVPIEIVEAAVKLSEPQNSEPQK